MEVGRIAKKTRVAFAGLVLRSSTGPVTKASQETEFRGVSQGQRAHQACRPRFVCTERVWMT